MHSKINKYNVAKRKIVSKKYSALNNDFINKNIKSQNNEVIYNSKFTSTLIVKGTKADIEEWAKNETVTEISLFVDLPLEPNTATVMPQINADNITGTKSSNFNNGTGYKGTGVRVGIMEADGGLYDHTSP